MCFEEETKLMGKYGLTIDLIDEDWRELFDTYPGLTSYNTIVDRWVAPGMKDQFITDLGRFTRKTTEIYIAFQNINKLIDSDTSAVIYEALIDGKFK